MARPLVVSCMLLLALIAAPASSGTSDLQCNGELAGVTAGNVTVPAGGSCSLTNSTVSGRVQAPAGSYFHAAHTRIGGDLVATGAQTLFVDQRSTIGGSLRANGVAQVFLFGSRVRKNVSVDRATDQVFICGSTVERGSIRVTRSARDIMIGGPRSDGCAGNSVRRGDMAVLRNSTDVQLVVSGNKFPKGNLVVSGNTGSSPKTVQGNSGGKRIACQANAPRFRASQNRRWKRGACRPS
jgi:hypothetical protein